MRDTPEATKKKRKKKRTIRFLSLPLFQRHPPNPFKP